jgi:uncharacterized protein (TIGR04141 family)
MSRYGSGAVAWCFGYGSRALRRAATDSRFGLMVALNALARLPEISTAAEGARQGPNRPHLRDMATRSMLGPRHHSSYRAARNVLPEAFPVDRRSQLVRSVGGRSSDPLLGVVRGGRSLAFRRPVELIEEFLALSSELLERAADYGYEPASLTLIRSGLCTAPRWPFSAPPCPIFRVTSIRSTTS